MVGQPNGTPGPGPGALKELIWNYQSPHATYTIQKELGRGKFGTTVLATHKITGQLFACKCINKHSPEFHYETVRREVEILNVVSAHPNVAGLHEVYEDNNHVYVLMEPCLGGELFDLIVERGYFSERDAAIVARTLLQVVEFCHHRQILHRDLKPENFLLKQKNAKIDKENLRAIDFGLSCFHKLGDVCREVVGSAYYLAPEVLRGHYAWEADVWSIGVIAYIMLCGMPPFWGRSDGEIFDRVLHEPVDLQIDPWPEVSKPAKDFVARLLVRDPRRRMTAEAALAHPWIRNHAKLPDKPLSPLVLTRLREFTQVSKLRCYMLNLVANHLSDDDVGSLRATFMALDEDGSGYITADEFRKGLRQMEADMDEETVEGLLQQLTLSNQGQLSYAEFVAAALDTQKHLTAQLLTSIFAELDVDGDGYLSPEELAAGLSECEIFDSVDALRELVEAEGLPAGPHKGYISIDTFQNLLMANIHRRQIPLEALQNAVQQAAIFANASRFKQVASLVVARVCAPEELADIRAMFEELDTDRSGTISLKVLQEALDQKALGGQMSELMAALDVRHDGQCAYDAFVAAVLEEQAKLTEHKLLAAFNFIDRDGDGRINADDLKLMLDDLRIDLGESETLMAMADTNRDGVIDFDEFKALMLNTAHPNILTRTPVAEASAAPSLVRLSMGADAFGDVPTAMPGNLGRASMAPSLARVSGAPNLSRTSGAPNLSRYSGMPNLARFSGAPNLARMSGAPNLARQSGAAPSLTRMSISGGQGGAPNLVRLSATPKPGGPAASFKGGPPNLARMSAAPMDYVMASTPEEGPPLLGRVSMRAPAPGQPQHNLGRVSVVGRLLTDMEDLWMCGTPMVS